MRAETLKTQKQVEVFNNRSLGIQSYGAYNDLPQRIMEIVEASATGASCVETYRKFIAGRGFEVEAFYRAIINEKRETADDLLHAISDDFARFGGFALHINYNALYQIVEVTHVPLEWVRFDELGSDYSFSMVAVHPDWGKRFGALRRFSSADIERYHLYDPTPETIDAEVASAGGWENYKGQILYYSNRGEKVYPMPIYGAVLTDMSNEEGLSNITQRNVRHNFLPAGMLVDFDNTANTEGQENETKEELKAFQGDMAAGQLMYVNVREGETAPEFKPFTANNYDKAFTNAEEKTPEIIGRAFVQPPILRAQDVGSNFGATLMQNAYDFYNSITENERMVIERVFAQVFSRWHDPSINTERNYSIIPKEYRVNMSLAEKLGDNTDRVLEVLRSDMAESAKRVILSKIFNLTDEDINELLEGLRV